MCKAVQFSEGNAVTSAVMASTVDHVWNDRGRKNAVEGAGLKRCFTCPQLSVQEEEKVAFHHGRLDLQSCTWPFLGQQGVHAATAFHGGVCGGYLVVLLLLVDDEEEDVAVEEERGGDLLQLPDSMWDRPGNYHLEGLTSDFTRAHPTGLRMPENFEPT